MGIAATIRTPAEGLIVPGKKSLEPILKTENLWKLYHAGKVEVPAQVGLLGSNRSKVIVPPGALPPERVAASEMAPRVSAEGVARVAMAGLALFTVSIAAFDVIGPATFVNTARYVLPVNATVVLATFGGEARLLAPET